ncbi:hypothetical protein [Pararhizobium sp.]|uniref:hypothetical protein n=1 Tax=Pararhizobium sp. TaxID=1977563 RepID=UPI00271CB121|nr:hypothetical protein [Pararhizobium sp.]MDO9415136.1 hypothetical protein [Pararhizobium sp.]
MFFQALKKGFTADSVQSGTSSAPAPGNVWEAVTRDLNDIEDQRTRSRTAADGAA